MKTKAIFFIALASLVLIIVLNNKHEVLFWFFGHRSVSLPLLLVIVWVFGLLAGLVVSHRGKSNPELKKEEEDDEFAGEDNEDPLSEEDRDYIS